MSRLRKIIRPVGNKVSFRSEKFEHQILSPYDTYFYQSGTAALSAAISVASCLKPDIDRPEVLIPAYGCPDLISAIVFAGAVPVLVDLEANTPWMSIADINLSMSAKTIAIVAVNFLGIAERCKDIANICLSNEILLIEDSAQGFPKENASEYWYADLVILSFGRGKPVNLLSGGALLNKNPILSKYIPSPETNTETTISRLKYYFKIFAYNISINSIPYSIIANTPGLKIGHTYYKPLSELRCIPPTTLSLLANNLKSYKDNYNYYVLYKYSSAISAKVNLVKMLNHPGNTPLLRFPITVADNKQRDKIYERLQCYGLSKMYQITLNNIPTASSYIANKNKSCINANRFAESLITLPIHSSINDKISNIISDEINSIVQD